MEKNNSTEESEYINENDNACPEDHNSRIEFIEMLTTLLNSESLHKSIDRLLTFREDKLSNDTKINADNIRYSLRRYWQDILMVVIILLTIVVLSIGTTLLDKSTIGTLLGSVIGYALGRFRNKPE